MTRRKQASWLLRCIALGFALAASLTGADFEWNLPKGFPRPAVPADNPMSAAKVELGRYLFYDKRMSVNGKESCGIVTARNWLSRMDAPAPRAPPANSIREAA